MKTSVCPESCGACPKFFRTYRRFATFADLDRYVKLQNPDVDATLGYRRCSAQSSLNLGSETSRCFFNADLPELPTQFQKELAKHSVQTA